MNAQQLTYPNHLISTAQLSASDAEALFAKASHYLATNRKADKKDPALKGLTHLNVFFEPSTRTRTSFELAGKRLGMDVINISGSASSTSKGESLLDTALTLNAMQPDVIVLRHAQSGAAKLFAEHVDCSVINAGDGSHAHPTQALLDAFTILQQKKQIKGLKVTICGDIANSRVARSNTTLLTMLGADVTLVAPPQLMPRDVESLDCEYSYRFDDALKDADVVMLLRLQHERAQGRLVASIREYFHLYGLTYERLALAKPDALVLHPGPINRGVEIETALADDMERTSILAQVEAGVAMRQALLVNMLQHRLKEAS